MLELYGERAGLADGQQILELGCGWGSLTLWMAERYPARGSPPCPTRTASASTSWRSARRVGCTTSRCSPATSTSWNCHARFDRCVSVEMFEHVRNYERLLARIAQWLKPDGAVRAHLRPPHADVPVRNRGRRQLDGPPLLHRRADAGGRYLLHFQRDLRLEQRWLLDGTHYQRTADHWLANQDAARERVMPVLVATYGQAAARIWWQRWRMFWMACAELFGYDDGQQWLVAHYLFRPR
jgi:cyclopropane-fatty-acyl-phospholipid synthase